MIFLEYDLYSQYVMMILPSVVDIMRCLLHQFLFQQNRAERFKFCLENNSLQLSIYIFLL